MISEFNNSDIYINSETRAAGQIITKCVNILTLMVKKHFCDEMSRFELSESTKTLKNTSIEKFTNQSKKVKEKLENNSKKNHVRFVIQE